MNVLIASDKFKDSLTALKVCEAIKSGILSVLPKARISVLPLADGGEGSIDILKEKFGFEKINIAVNDPLGRTIESYYYLDNNHAYIQLSNASGLMLLNKNERNPLNTSTYGTGQMIKDALSKGSKKIYLFLGGSATNDMGMGMASALGFEFLNKENLPVKPVGKNLRNIHTIEPSKVSPDLWDAEFIGVCDVENPLFGLSGAAHIYARQKGADNKAIQILEEGAQHLSKIIKAQLSREVALIPGTGAAGGFGAGILSFLKGTLVPGSSFILDALSFDDALRNADLVITGEGSVDIQTKEGKVISEVVRRAGKRQIPVWIFAGVSSLTPKDFDSPVVRRVESIIDRSEDKEDAMINAAIFLREMARECISDNIK